MKIIVVLYFMLCMCAGFVLYQICEDYIEWVKKTKLKADCNFNLPYGYRLIESVGTGEYGIILNDKYYLRYRFSENEVAETSLPEYATTFKDSCKAKAFCKKYYKQTLKYIFR